MNGILADLRHALRVYGSTPIASGLAVVALAVAMALVSSLLSLYVDIAFETHPGFADSRALVTIGQNDGVRIGGVSSTLIDRINEEVGSVAAMAGFMPTQAQVGPEREQRPVEYVTRAFFGELRPRLELGRGFDERDHDPDAEPVIIISHSYWLEAFGGSQNVLGDMLEITGRPGFVFDTEAGSEPPAEETTYFRIVGVMSPSIPALSGFDTVVGWLPAEVALPRYVGPWDNVRHFMLFRGLGRLAGGVEPSAVARVLDARFQGADDLNLNPNQPFDAMRGLVRDINAQRSAERQLRLFLAGSVLLALVAAANVSLFLLSRAPGRRRELGIRMSVGAPMQRLARQLATEAGALVVLATALGLILSFWLQGFLQGLAFLEGAGWQDAGVGDWRVLGVVIVFVLLLTLLVALAPVKGLKRLGIAASSREVATRANVTQRTACTVQIAAAGAVGSAALVFAWYLLLLTTADRGYDIRDVQAVTMTQTTAAAGTNLSTEFDALLVERERRRRVLLGIPGVTSVAFGSSAPGLGERGLQARIPSPSAPDEIVQFSGASADREYFEMLDIGVVDGRVFDGTETDVMIANEAAAELLWGKIDVVGETLPVSLSDADSTEIIGVVADVGHAHPDQTVTPRVYVPVFPFSGLDSIFVRTTLPSAELRAAIEDLIAAGDLEIELADVQSLERLVGQLLAADRTRSYLTLASAALVLVLAGFGFYGTQRFLVAAGRREYAIRASLGAGPKALARLVLARGLMLGLPGVALGAILSFIVAAWLRDDFVSRDVAPGLVALAVVAGLVGLLLAASWPPAVKARRAPPAPVLREG